jgi:hypothetical protein
MSENEKDGGPAFPMLPPDTHNYREWPASPGMSLRDYFAAKALEGCVYMGDPDDTQDVYLDKMARAAYRIADAMLKAREQS